MAKAVKTPLNFAPEPEERQHTALKYDGIHFDHIRHLVINNRKIWQHRYDLSIIPHISSTFEKTVSLALTLYK